MALRDFEVFCKEMQADENAEKWRRTYESVHPDRNPNTATAGSEK
jgi:hypothetical protein